MLFAGRGHSVLVPPFPYGRGGIEAGGKILFNFNRLNKFLHKSFWSSGCGDVEILPLEANLGIT